MHGDYVAKYVFIALWQVVHPLSLIPVNSMALDGGDEIVAGSRKISLKCPVRIFFSNTLLDLT